MRMQQGLRLQKRRPRGPPTILSFFSSPSLQLLLQPFYGEINFLAVKMLDFNVRKHDMVFPRATVTCFLHLPQIFPQLVVRFLLVRQSTPQPLERLLICKRLLHAPIPEWYCFYAKRRQCAEAAVILYARDRLIAETAFAQLLVIYILLAPSVLSQMAVRRKAGAFFPRLGRILANSLRKLLFRAAVDKKNVVRPAYLLSTQICKQREHSSAPRCIRNKRIFRLNAYLDNVITAVTPQQLQASCGIRPLYPLYYRGYFYRHRDTGLELHKCGFSDIAQAVVRHPRTH